MVQVSKLTTSQLQTRHQHLKVARKFKRKAAEAAFEV
jgi:hypothetical protein